MVVGLPSFPSERPNKDRRAERCRDRPILLDGLRVGKKSIADAIYVGGRAPGVNAFRAANLMRRRPVAAICADENRRIDFAAKILQEPRKENDCAWYIMRKLAQEQSRFTAVN